jgi:hypothetical protein
MNKPSNDKFAQILSMFCEGFILSFCRRGALLSLIFSGSEKYPSGAGFHYF